MAHEQPADRHQAAEHIATEADRLALLARRHGLDALTYILEMTMIEATEQVRRSRNPGS